MRRIPCTVLTAVASVTPAAIADEIVQEGFLSGGGGTPVSHVIPLDQFDPAAGTLNFVRLDFLTSVSGGGQTDGSGIAVEIYAQLTAEYALGAAPVASTEALVNTVIPNDGPPIAFSVFDTDTAEMTYDAPEDLTPWIGAGTIDLDALTQLTVWSDPPDVIGFGAGGTVRYTVTYDYTPAAPCPQDLDGDGSIAFGDLLRVLSAWGPCASCAEDLDASGAVGFEDLLAVLSSWGPCP